MIPYRFFGKGTLKIAQVKNLFQAHDEAWVGITVLQADARKRRLCRFGEVWNYGQAETGSEGPAQVQARRSYQRLRRSAEFSAKSLRLSRPQVETPVVWEMPALCVQSAGTLLQIR